MKPSRPERFLLVFGFVLLAIPPAAFCEAGKFTPTIYSNYGELEIGGLYDHIKNTTNGKGRETTDVITSEKFRLTTIGYVYHPRFVTFLGRLAVGFNQEKFTQDIGPSSDGSWHNAFTDEYELRAYALPEHPYNLEVYTLRKNPYIRGQLSGGYETVIYDSGAIFRYRKRPYTFLLSYDYTTIESKTSTTDSGTLAAIGAYTKDWGEFSGAFTHTDSDIAQDVGESTEFRLDDYTFRNSLFGWKKRVRLTTLVGETDFHQNDPISTVDDKRFTWSEQLAIDLPWNFDTNFSYRFVDDDMTTRRNEDGTETSFSTRNQNAGLQIKQRLYKSLVTSYILDYSKTESSTGDLTSLSHAFNSVYTKQIPYGNMTAGVSLGTITSERAGAPTIVNETHNAQIFDEFTLISANIEASSLAVTVKSAQSGNRVDMVRDIHYSVTQVGNTLRIRILSVPPEASSPDPFFTYEFRVTYSLVTAVFKIETKNSGYSLKLSLFNHFFNPYYSHFRSNQEVVSGFIAGGGDTVTVDTVGVSFEGGDYSLIGEYQDYDSRLNPSKTYKAEANTRSNITPTTRFTTRGYYTRIEHIEVPEQRSIGFTERTVGGGVGFEKRFPRPHVNISISASSSYAKGLFATTRYLINSARTWKIAKLDLKLGADIGSTETELPNGKQEASRTVFYLTLKRVLFGGD
jgi:hypothetical protein